MFEHQVKQHEKEQKFIKYLKNINFPFKDYTNTDIDLYGGVDIVITEGPLAGRVYDLKVTDKYKLTLIKEFDNGDREYPLDMHTNVPILLVTEEEGKYKGYVLDKGDIKDSIRPIQYCINNVKHYCIPLTKYTGDYNTNWNISIFDSLETITKEIIDFESYNK